MVIFCLSWMNWIIQNHICNWLHMWWQRVSWKNISPEAFKKKKKKERCGTEKKHTSSSKCHPGSSNILNFSQCSFCDDIFADTHSVCHCVVVGLKIIIHFSSPPQTGSCTSFTSKYFMCLVYSIQNSACFMRARMKWKLFILPGKSLAFLQYVLNQRL